MAPIAEQHRRPLDPTEYAAMVERTRAVVGAAVPPGTTVAVISRGDDALLALGAQRGWHFPRAASGAYAGHHPPDSAAAIQHLEELRCSGVHHLVLPASARWWLDHYDGFAAHLDAHAERIAEDEACTVFALAGTPAASPPAPAAAAEATSGPVPPVEATTLARARRFLDALLPDACRVLLAGPGWEPLELAARGVERLEGGTAAALAAADAARRAGGPAYLAIPLPPVEPTPPGWLGELLAAMEARQPALARRARLVAVFDLQAAPAPTNGRVPA